MRVYVTLNTGYVQMFVVAVSPRDFKFLQCLFLSRLDVGSSYRLFLGESLGLAALLAIMYYYYTEVLLMWRSYAEGGEDRAFYNLMIKSESFSRCEYQC